MVLNISMKFKKKKKKFYDYLLFTWWGKTLQKIYDTNYFDEN